VIYGALRLKNFKTSSHNYGGDRGEQVLAATWRMVNHSQETLYVPLTVIGEQPLRAVGIRQWWIERLGEYKDIPCYNPKALRIGDRYAANGFVIVSEPEWPAKEHVDFAYTWPAPMDVTCFPKGRYRIDMEFRKLHQDGYGLLDIDSRTFRVR
jgi:hypothetical protein